MAAPDPEQERIIESLNETRLRFTLVNDPSLVAPLIRRLEESGRRRALNLEPDRFGTSCDGLFLLVLWLISARLDAMLAGSGLPGFG
jgi:hypothetical protein